MAIELATQFQAYTDEQFYSESKTSLVTNKDFNFDGAKTIKLYKVKTTDMEDFNRNGPILDGNKSQYGTISTLQATTETFTINKDRSFSSRWTRWTRTKPRCRLQPPALWHASSVRRCSRRSTPMFTA